jgi:tetratricopeptide (TPR) repeat protein
VRGHADSAFEAAPAKPAAAATAAAKLGQELDASTLLPAEVAAAALLEKEKGNECFRAREYDEAVVFYTRSLHLVSTDPAVLNNRALAFLRLKQLDNALNDVSLVLQQDATNWKALWRRGQVHEARLFLERALDDFKLAQSHWSRTPEAAQTPVHPDIAKNIRKVEKQLSEQEPNHPYVQHLRPAAAATTKSSKQEEEKQNASAPAPQPQQAFKRMAIAEVDEDEEEEEEEEEDQTPQATTASVTGVAAAPVQPADAPAAAAAPPQPTSSMRRMPIAEVDDDDEEDEDAEEVVATKPATPTPAPAPAPAKAKVKKVAEPAFHSKSGGMMIELVDDEEEEEERAAAAAEKEAANARNKAAAASASAASPAAAKPVAAAAATSMLPSASSSFVMPPVPSSSVAFQRDWAELRSAQRPAADQFAYLRSIEPATLVKLLAGGASGSGAVDAKLFAQVLSLCGSHWVSSDLSRAVQLLQLLSTSGRFALNVGMAGSEIRAVLKQALQRAVDRAEGADEIEGVAVEAIKALIKKY